MAARALTAAAACDIKPKMSGPSLPSESYRGLYRLARRLLVPRSYEAALDDIVEQTLQLVGAERGFLVTVKGQRVSFRVVRNWSRAELERTDRVSRSIVQHVLEQNEAILVPDALFDERFGGRSSVIELKTRSVLAAPIRVGDENTRAVLYLENQNPDRLFEEVQFELFRQVLGMAGDLMESSVARLLSEDVSDALADFPFEGLMTRNAEFRASLEVAARVAPSELPVLIQGASGTGKELVARAIHRASPRGKREMQAVNCGALSATVLDSELFGHVRGAFTGAHKDRAGLLVGADRGTLFLDEIGELPLELQPKLLRVMQFGEVRPVGAERMRQIDVRVIAATNRDLASEVESGSFREDLLYRLNAVTIEIPPLAERQEDVAPLFRHFLAREGDGTRETTADLEHALLAYPWPGNVRELENEARRVTALTESGSTLTPEHLSPRVYKHDDTSVSVATPGPPLSLEESEKRLIERHLRANDGNRTRTAKALGISREGLRKKMKRYELT